MSTKKIIAGIIILLVIIGIFSLKSLAGKNSNNFVQPLGTTETEKTCPSGFIKVPGNPDYSTQDFCLMKYDTKCSNTNPACVTKEGVYRNDLPGCACEGNFQVVSTPKGAPITYIPEDDGTLESAKAYCKNSDWHLVTNNEWMTVARNIEQVEANWCNRDGTGCDNPPGTPGKILANGHNDDNPNYALTASTDDKPCFGTTSDGSNTCGGRGSQKRTLTLSNGEIVWDMAGNVWQWIDAEIARKDEPRTIVPGEGNLRWTWGEFQTVPVNSTFSPSNPEWNSTQGVGRIYHYNSIGDTDTTLYTYIRAGNWRHGYDSGIFTIHLSPVASKTGIDDVGFRCATNLK
jgi:hypothetical protein